MDEFSIREATQNDKEDVLAIHNNVYAGFDYLPQFYDHFMSAKNSKSFVLLHGEKIVSNSLCQCPNIIFWLKNLPVITQIIL